MESKETTQTNNFTDDKQVEVSTQAEPKDKNQEHFELGIAEVFKSVSIYTLNYRKEVLQAALEKVTKAIEPIEKIVEIEQEIKRTCDGLLDEKAKAVLATLSVVSSMSGFTNVGDYCTDILHGSYGQKDVKQAREQFPDDKDVNFLSYVFGLANSVCEAESKMHMQGKSAEEETADEPQAEVEAITEDDEPEDEETQQIEGPTPITALQNWLAKRTYAEKLTAILLWQLLNKDHLWEKEGYCEKHFGNNLFSEYEQTVVNASQDKEYLDKADSEEIVITSMVTALLPMRV